MSSPQTAAGGFYAGIGRLEELDVEGANRALREGAELLKVLAVESAQGGSRVVYVVGHRRGEPYRGVAAATVPAARREDQGGKPQNAGVVNRPPVPALRDPRGPASQPQPQPQPQPLSQDRASDRQLNFIASLAKAPGAAYLVEEAMQLAGVGHVSQLSKDQASELIRSLRALAAATPGTVAANRAV